MHRTPAHTIAVPAAKPRPSLSACENTMWPWGTRAATAAAARPIAPDPPAQLGAEEVGQGHPDGGEQHVGQTQEQQPAVGPMGELGEPDQRRGEQVVERRVVGHPHPPVPVVLTRVGLGLPLHRPVRDVGGAVDLGHAGSRRSRGRSRGGPSRRGRRTVAAGRRTAPRSTRRRRGPPPVRPARSAPGDRMEPPRFAVRCDGRFEHGGARADGPKLPGKHRRRPVAPDGRAGRRRRCPHRPTRRSVNVSEHRRHPPVGR